MLHRITVKYTIYLELKKTHRSNHEKKNHGFKIKK